MRRWFAAAAVLAVVAMACGDGADGETNDPSPSGESSAIATPSEVGSQPVCSALEAQLPGEFEKAIISGGVEREYILHVPPDYDGETPLPLVMLFHGFALAGRSMLDYSALGTVADREGFLLVAPTGTGDPHRWNSTPGTGVDDVLFVNDLLDELERTLCVDTERVFATGYSNGGGMSMRLACEMPERVRAAGLVAAVFQRCAPDTPLIAFHGTEDALVSFEAGPFPSIRDSVAGWASALACASPPAVERPSDHIERVAYSGCGGATGERVQLYVIEGGGHTWPGADRFGDPTQTTQEIDASGLIWQFFTDSVP